MQYPSLIIDVASYLKDYMEKHETSNLRFHNSIHVQEVVKAATEMAEHYKLPEKEYTIVVVAAYFHDIGYFDVGNCGHEKRSAEMAEQFLRSRNVDEDMISAIFNCILATQPPQSPKNLVEEIVCDADLFHLGNDWFAARNKLMRKEAEACGAEIDKSEWRRNTIALLENHTFHTSYCRELLSKKKQENIEALKKKEAQLMINEERVPEKDPQTKNKKNNRPNRGIETMFRITSTNNQRLSDMADNKSNILITVNSIILSVVIALLLRNLDNNAHLIFPTTILLSISLATIVIAILATRPSIPSGSHSVEEIKEKKVNLLFFGNFHKMRLEDYNKGMQELMEDRDYLYGTLIKDVYSQGVVLGRKYKLLRLAYSIFMYGLIVSVLAFLVVVIINV